MNKEITYEPDNSIKHGFWSIFTGIFDELAYNRWLTYQLFKRDFTGMYKQSFIGMLWIVIVPVINVGVFAMLNRAGIFNVGDINAYNEAQIFFRPKIKVNAEKIMNDTGGLA